MSNFDLTGDRRLNVKRIFTISVITVLLVSLVLIPYPVSAANPTEVWVDDDWAGSSHGDPVDGHTFGTDAFATIQDGINATDPPVIGIVNVAAGTYSENIIIKFRPKIKILGAGAAVTTINGGGNGSVVWGNNMHADSRIEGFTITGGVAASPPGWGGGFYLESSATTIASCNITGNSAVIGGGIYLTDKLGTGMSPKVINCLVKNNSASALGGGIFFFGSTLSPTVMNSTIADNPVGDGVYNSLASTTITNTIIYGNSTNNLYDAGGGTSTTSFSLIGTDPLFVGPGDYHLRSGSPAIDAGTNTGAPDNDLDGNSRIVNSVVDMGAYEFGASDGDPPTSIQATADIDPDTLNKNSKGKWITCYIELPEGYDVADIDISTLLLNDTVPAEPSPTEIGDYDSDGIADLMVKFDRQKVIDKLEWDWTMVYSEEITITLNLNDGTAGEGSDTIKVLPEENKGKGKGKK